ncbi:hypothetical protein IMZ31_19325 (plasmid) [Pontibacillus sp. ALD_SL1]|uniref:DUF6063 family protein n=1 Tax=Pontibacillus sp. ALD_SL1 TaxID=2777185 RepID=UPI001A96DAEB|nr:DUF6063 family protein [Pontibacillus sp. ALD_SL1]QST02702.1 hypothetical protein IMZ31_19325 [Pontibacillus sp. ALD_SL1]
MEEFNAYERAFKIYDTLYKFRSTDDTEMLSDFDTKEVRDALNSMEKQAEVLIHRTDSRLYMSRTLNNPFLAYTKDELKEVFGLDKTTPNRYVHLAQLIMQAILAEFYNSEDNSLSGLDRQFLTLEGIEEKMTSRLQYVLEENKEFIEEVGDEHELDLLGAAQAWDRLQAYKETEAYKRTKTRIAFIHRVTDFLKDEGLLMYVNETQFIITEKMRDIIDNYYFNSERKGKIMRLMRYSLDEARSDFQQDEEDQ